MLRTNEQHTCSRPFVESILPAYLCGHDRSRPLELHDPGHLVVLEAIEKGVLQSAVNADGVPAAAGCGGVTCA